MCIYHRQIVMPIFAWISFSYWGKKEADHTLMKFLKLLVGWNVLLCSCIFFFNFEKGKRIQELAGQTAKI